MSASPFDEELRTALKGVGVATPEEAWQVLSRTSLACIQDPVLARLAAIGLAVVLDQLKLSLPESLMESGQDPVARVLTRGLSVPGKERP